MFERGLTKSGREVLVRGVCAEDAELLVGYMKTVVAESDFLTLGEGDFKVTVEEERKYIARFCEADNKVMLVAEVGGEIVGLVSFDGGEFRRVRHAGQMGLSVRRDCWGEGIGSLLMKCLIEWAKRSGVVRKINLKVLVGNERAIAIYRKYGFVDEGISSREHFENGEFQDALIMGLAVD